MKKNAKKSLITLITILTLITPSSQKKEADEQNTTFASRFYNIDKIIEKIKDDYFYLKEEETEQVLESIKENTNGIFFNSQNILTEEESVSIYQRISPNNEIIEIVIADQSFKIAFQTKEINQNKVTECYYKFPIFKRAIDYVTVYSNIVEDQYKNTLTEETRVSSFQTTNSYKLKLLNKYIEFNFKICQTDIEGELSHYAISNENIDDIIIISEKEYFEMVEYFKNNINQENYAIMINDINDFIKKINNHKSKTI